MIYPYLYLTDDIEKLHEYVEAFFDSMLASKNTRFTQSLIHPKFLPLVIKKGDILLAPMKKIFKAFKILDANNQQLVVSAFKINNSIEELCKGNLSPMQYPELKKISPHLSEQTKKLFKNLYEEIVNQEYFPSKKQHFQRFRTLNRENIICPFCGLSGLFSDGDALDNKKDDYDHWLSKGKFPFSSVNFKNLVPMCGICNQKYKQQKNTIFEVPIKGKPIRKKTFYPYGTNITTNAIRVKIKDVTTGLKAGKWNLELEGPIAQTEELESWNRIFDIESRYKNRIIQRYEVSWFTHVTNLYKKRKIEPNFDFKKFQEEILDNVKLPNLQESAIIEIAYFEYLFSVNNLQLLLDATIGAKIS